MTDDRDLLVAKALQDLRVPDHGPDFWRNLEVRLADVPAPPRRLAVSAPSVAPPDEEGDGDLPVVADLTYRRPRRSAAWIASVAAVFVLGAATMVTLTSGDPAADRVRTADRPEGGQQMARSEDPSSTRVPPASSAPDTGPSPRAVLVAWLTAVGAGDTTTAAALTGPRSKSYVEALTGGAGIDGFLREAGEGYGAWADSPDRSTTEVALDADGEDITIVVVSGTWTGEGGTGFRTDAIPVVRSDDGEWLVEPWAIDPDTGGRITVTSPKAADEAGFQPLDPDDVLSAAAPGAGTFHFSLDDQPASEVAAEKAGGGVRATFDPPGSMSTQTHRFLIAYVDGPTVSAVTGTFEVGR